MRLISLGCVGRRFNASRGCEWGWKRQRHHANVADAFPPHRIHVHPSRQPPFCHFNESTMPPSENNIHKRCDDDNIFCFIFLQTTFFRTIFFFFCYVSPLLLGNELDSISKIDSTSLHSLSLSVTKNFFLAFSHFGRRRPKAGLRRRYL